MYLFTAHTGHLRCPEGIYGKAIDKLPANTVMLGRDTARIPAEHHHPAIQPAPFPFHHSVSQKLTDGVPSALRPRRDKVRKWTYNLDRAELVFSRASSFGHIVLDKSSEGRVLGHPEVT